MTKGGSFVIPEGKLPDIFTVNDLNEDQRLVRDTAKKVVAETIITDEAVKLIELKDLAYQRNLLKNLAEIGFTGAEIPEEYGGTDMGPVAAAIIAEKIAKEGSFATAFLAHTGIGMSPLKSFGTKEQKDKYLPKLVSGEWVAAYSLTEPTAGSDADGGCKAKAHISEDGKNYILNGTKRFVTNLNLADLFTVFAKIDDDEHITAFLVERSFPGVVLGKEEHKMGIQGSSTGDLVLGDAMVPVENLLGERGKGHKIAYGILNLGRFKLGAACLGGGKAALKESTEYSKERKQFGQPIGNFGAIREKLANMAAKNYAMETVVYRTAGLLQDAVHGVGVNDSRAALKAIEEYAVECSLVKVFCSEALDYIVDENVQIHGGSGFCEGAPERHYRDSRINRIFEGTNEINRLLAVGMLLKKAAMGSLPLMSAIKRVIGESLTPSITTEPEDNIERLTYYLNNAKKVVLLVAGSAYQKFGLKLEEHQIILMSLSDCLINLFVMESSLAALAKNKRDSDTLLVQMIFNDGLFSLERLARETIPMCSGGDDQRTTLAMVRRLLKFTPANKEELCNGISDNLLGA